MHSKIFEIYTPPFKFNGVYLLDSKGEIVADFAPLSRTFRKKKHKDTVQIHREIGDAIADCLNNKYNIDTPEKNMNENNGELNPIAIRAFLLRAKMEFQRIHSTLLTGQFEDVRKWAADKVEKSNLFSHFEPNQKWGIASNLVLFVLDRPSPFDQFVPQSKQNVREMNSGSGNNEYFKTSNPEEIGDTEFFKLVDDFSAYLQKIGYKDHIQQDPWGRIKDDGKDTISFFLEKVQFPANIGSMNNEQIFQFLANELKTYVENRAERSYEKSVEDFYGSSTPQTDAERQAQAKKIKEAPTTFANSKTAMDQEYVERNNATFSSNEIIKKANEILKLNPIILKNGFDTYTTTINEVTRVSGWVNHQTNGDWRLVVEFDREYIVVGKRDVDLTFRFENYSINKSGFYSILEIFYMVSEAYQIDFNNVLLKLKTHFGKRIVDDIKN